jgi:hypothetical protein
MQYASRYGGGLQQAPERQLRWVVPGFTQLHGCVHTRKQGQQLGRVPRLPPSLLLCYQLRLAPEYQLLPCTFDHRLFLTTLVIIRLSQKGNCVSIVYFVPDILYYYRYFKYNLSYQIFTISF